MMRRCNDLRVGAGCSMSASRSELREDHRQQLQWHPAARRQGWPARPQRRRQNHTAQAHIG